MYLRLMEKGASAVSLELHTVRDRERTTLAIRGEDGVAALGGLGRCRARSHGRRHHGFCCTYFLGHHMRRRRR